MKQRFFLAVLGVGALTVSAPLIGCGDFSADEEEPGTGGVAGDGDASTGGMTGDGDTSTGGVTGDGDGTGGAAAVPDLVVSCENVVACGGDVTGNWFATDSCLSLSGTANLTALGIGCTEGTAGGSFEQIAGNWVFDADMGILTDTTQTLGTIEMGLSAACRDVSSTLVNCDGVQGPLESLGLVAGSGVCLPSETLEEGCDCTGSVDQKSVAGFVTRQLSDVALYTTEGNVLSVQGNVTVDYDYCVQGDTMLVTPKTVGDAGTTTGTILFKRQP